MTSFNVESQFLDLKKTYQNFQYENLISQGIVGNQNDNIHNNENIYHGMTQNTYLFVQQKQILIKDIQNISIYFTNKYWCKIQNIKQQAYLKFPFDKVRDRVCFIFQKYQQQPTLLDSLLEHLIQPIMQTIKGYLSFLMKNQSQIPTLQLHSLLEIIYQLTKVRQKKWVIHYFPHQVKDLYPILGYLSRQKNQTAYWQSRYVILLWLGMIVLVPFDLQIIDSGKLEIQRQNGQCTNQIMQMMVLIGKHYLKSLTKIKQASAEFIGKLFTRIDVQKRNLLQQYITYTIEKLNQKEQDQFFICGLYRSIYEIFKRVQRNELLPLIDPILQQLKYQKQIGLNIGSIKEIKIKILTRIGITYLKPRIVQWSYKRKKKSLLNNLQQQNQKNKIKKIKTNTQNYNNTNNNKKQQLQIKKNNINNNKQQQQSNLKYQNQLNYYKDVNKQNLEEIIQLLIDGLNQKQTNVRQNASKGLGMIAGRLSQDMVMDIIQYIVNLTPNPQTRHAICLTIAELIRRNLIDPNKLIQMYQLIKDSLIYQKQQGGYSVGQAVRDSACYMTWSVARAYQQGGQQLGISLMIVACFDREVGCRRAASAAYQQLVGRVGNVPNGIEILTEADYFTLGLQKNAYLNVSIFVASYQAYFYPFVEHLCYQKLRHWDLQIKRIAACSLSLMCPLNAKFMAQQILPSLTKYLNGDTISIKLGIIIGIGQILLGLKGLSHQHQLYNQMKDSVFLKSLTQNQKKLIKAGQYMSKFKQKYQQNRYNNNIKLINQEILLEIIINIQQKIKNGKLYKGKAGQIFRIYTCRLLECFSICQIKLTKQQIVFFQDFIQQSIKNPLEPILLAGAKCLGPFLTQYYQYQQDDKFILNLISSARKNTPLARCYTFALSKLSRPIYLIYYQQLLDVLEYNCLISKENNDPQKRKYAILGIEALVTQIGFSSEKFDTTCIQKVFKLLFSTCEDYTMDKRGDIGSIVRQATMTVLMRIIEIYSHEQNPKWTIELHLIQKAIALILQQLCEKIDRIRLLAGSLLQQFFDRLKMKFPIAENIILYKIFCQENIKNLIKNSENTIDNNLQTQVIKIEMKIQLTIFNQTERYLIYYWNIPHSIFPIIVPILQYKDYCYFIMKGLCTSTGGISESIIKYSLQQLGKYITWIFQSSKQHQLMNLLMRSIIQLLKDNFRNDRIIVPLYKTLDYIIQRQQVSSWHQLHSYDTELFYLITKQVSKTKSIIKITASTGLYVSLLMLNNEQTKHLIIQSIIKILCSDLPKARKSLADKLLMVLMSQQSYIIFTEEQNDLLINFLSQYDFLDEQLPIIELQKEIQAIINTKIQ